MKLKSPNNAEDLKYILDAIQFLAKFLPNHSEKKTDRRRKLEKERTTEMRRSSRKNFIRIKQMFTEEPCLAHYAKDNENMITATASQTGLGNTLRQEQYNREIKPTAFGWMIFKRYRIVLLNH